MKDNPAINILTSLHRIKRSELKRILSLLIGGVIFLVIIPIILLQLGHLLEIIIYISLFWFLATPLLLVLSIAFIVIGLILVFWSTYTLYVVGKGSPVPIVPTQKLATNGPYKYCRNPMTLGTIIYYIGISILFRSTTTLIIIIPIFTLVVTLYLKFIEEKRLEVKFGDEYIRYKRKTPFLIPFLRKKHT